MVPGTPAIFLSTIAVKFLNEKGFGMAFGFGKKRDDDDDEEEDEDDEEEEDVDLVNFQGALNGKSVDMAANARLVQAALRPTNNLVTNGIERRADMIRVDVKGDKAEVAAHWPSMECRTLADGWQNRSQRQSFKCSRCSAGWMPG